ncbi:hypothetical protein VNO77_04834 [Canavalia gladiata]|uniref:Uncharacterized protein n=1 Tax=Canavalia gladiata TaxID=3824 RepID=A0AAN9N2B0_CANGL
MRTPKPVGTIYALKGWNPRPRGIVREGAGVQDQVGDIASQFDVGENGVEIDVGPYGGDNEGGHGVDFMEVDDAADFEGVHGDGELKGDKGVAYGEAPQWLQPSPGPRPHARSSTIARSNFHSNGSLGAVGVQDEILLSDSQP